MDSYEDRMIGAAGDGGAFLSHLPMGESFTVKRVDLLRDDGRGGHTGTAGKYDLLHVERPLAQRDGGCGPPAEYLVGAVGLEPTILAAEDFKSPAYANSATPPRA